MIFVSKADISTMLKQKEILADFKWNVKRLGFNVNNDSNWYAFSVPLFSTDRKKAIMMIENLCPGLCGTGSTIMFIKKKDKWTSNQGKFWIH